jgi:hypothetical protein
MKQRFGVRLAESYMRSRLWIAANHKKEDTASVSMIAQNWRRSGATIADFRGKQFAGLEIG